MPDCGWSSLQRVEVSNTAQSSTSCRAATSRVAVGVVVAAVTAQRTPPTGAVAGVGGGAVIDVRWCDFPLPSRTWYCLRLKSSTHKNSKFSYKKNASIAHNIRVVDTYHIGVVVGAILCTSRRPSGKVSAIFLPVELQIF